MIPRQNFTNSLAVSFSLAFTHGILVTLNTKFKTNKNFSCQIYFRFHYLAQHKASIRFSMNIMYLNGIFILIVCIYHLHPIGKLSLQLVLCQHYPSSQTNAIHCTKDLHKYSHLAIILLGTIMRNPMRSFFLNYSQKKQNQNQPLNILYLISDATP